MLRGMNAHSFNERTSADSHKQCLNVSIVNCLIVHIKNKKRERRF